MIFFVDLLTYPFWTRPRHIWKVLHWSSWLQRIWSRWSWSRCGRWRRFSRSRRQGLLGSLIPGRFIRPPRGLKAGSSWIIVENKLESSWHLVWKSSAYHWMCIYLVKKIRWRFKKQSRNTESNWCNKWVSDSPLWGSLKMNGNLSRALYTYIIINTLFGACQLTDFVNISYQLQEHEIQIAGLKLK